MAGCAAPSEPSATPGQATPRSSDPAATASPSAPSTPAPPSFTPGPVGEPPRLGLEPVAGGLSSPLDIAWRPDDPGSLFVVMTGRLNSANALMAEGKELRSIASVVIGGTNLFGGEGGVIGSMIGALIIGVLGNGLNLLDVSPFWQRVAQGLVIILVVIFDQWRRRRIRQA